MDTLSRGTLTVIPGCMFSGKTTELIRRVKRLQIAGRTVLVFKPEIDVRYGGVAVVSSHVGDSTEAVPLPVSGAHLIFSRVADTGALWVAIDEVQFFEPSIVDVILKLMESGVNVIVAGLDTDFKGEPFGCVPQLMLYAQELVKLTAICTKCGNEAIRTQRLVNGKPASRNSPLVLVGASETYEARCLFCHEVAV